MKIYTFKFIYQIRNKEEDIEFCAYSETEARKLYEQYWRTNPLWFGKELPQINSLEVVFEQSDKNEYGDDYGTPEEYDTIKLYDIPVEWAVCTKIKVRARTLQEAIEFVKENSSVIPLSDDPDYIDGSYQISSEHNDKSANDIAEDLITYYGEDWAAGMPENKDPIAVMQNKDKEVPSCVDPTYP